MKPEVDMSLVKEELAIPASIHESAYWPNVHAAIERGLVLEAVDFTYIAYTSTLYAPAGGAPALIPGENVFGGAGEGTEERTVPGPDVYFYTLQAYYRKAFEVYLLQTLRLDLLEKAIAESRLGFRQTDCERMSRLERLSNLDLKHLYVATPMHIEFLQQEDADILKRLYAENDSVITEEALGFVGRTYPDVVWTHSFPEATQNRDGKVVVSEIGAFGGSFPPGLDSLVISFTMPKEYGEDDLWEKRRAASEERKEFLLKNLPLFWEEMQPLLDVPLVLVIEGPGGYFDYAITDFVPYNCVPFVPANE